jgi:hypothetical protein
MLTTSLDAKRLIAKYEKLAAPHLDEMRAIERDPGRTAESKAGMTAELRKTLNTAFDTKAKELRALVETAQQNLRDNYVGNAQRRITMQKPEQIARATSIRALLAGASDLELFRSAQQAAADSDSAAAHGIRLELEARRIALGTKGPSLELTAKIVDELRFDKLVEREQAAIQELVLTRYFATLFETQGALLDATKSGKTAAGRMTALRSAGRVETETGQTREYRYADIEQMVTAMDLGDVIPAPRVDRTPAERMADFRSLLKAEEQRLAGEAHDAAARAQREQRAADDRANDRTARADSEIARLDLLKLQRDAEGPGLVQ